MVALLHWDPLGTWNAVEVKHGYSSRVWDITTPITMIYGYVNLYIHL